MFSGRTEYYLAQCEVGSAVMTEAKRTVFSSCPPGVVIGSPQLGYSEIHHTDCEWRVISLFNILLTVHHAMILGNCPT